MADDKVRDTPTIIVTIHQLQGLLAITPTRLIELSNDPRQPVRDTAVRALGRLDAGEGVPLLLDMMNDDRGRIAIYALRRAVLEMPVEQAYKILEVIPMVKVTVAKEVVRLLGELRSEAAYQQLLTMAQNKKLHRDIRVAVLRALWDFLERDTTWPVLETAAADVDPAIATIVGRIPTTRLSPLAQTRLARLLVGLMKHPDGRVRLNVLERCYQLPISDSEGRLLPGLLNALESPLPGEYTQAALAITATYTDQAAQRVGEATRQVLGRRKVVETLVNQLRDQAIRQRRLMLPTVRAVLQTLATDPITASLQMRLAVPGVEGPELLNWLLNLAQRNAWHEEALFAGVQEFMAMNTNFATANLEILEQGLAASSDYRLRRLGLAALVAQSRSTTGWQDDRLARLVRYRTDPSLLVAAAAQFTFSPGEN